VASRGFPATARLLYYIRNIIQDQSTSRSSSFINDTRQTHSYNGRLM